MIKREIQERIVEDFGSGKVIVLLGARQVGKTTLLEALREKGGKTLMLNCDDVSDRLLLEGRSSTELRALVEGYDTVFMDEVQRVRNIGLTLKMIGDLKLNTQVIATGSSSLDLADEIHEPATGRLIEYQLFPFSLGELAAETSEREEGRMLEQRMVYGLYPEVVMNPGQAKRTLMSLANSYLYKDLFTFQGIKKPTVLQKLVQALALQLGSEVSYNELAGLVGVDRGTVESYIYLLEKCFVVFRLDSFSRNQRNEIKKGKKVYFYDNGIRNAIINHFAPIELRTDVRALWENLMVSERVKRNAYRGYYAQAYFWRTRTQNKIDLVEDVDGMLHAFEFKWKASAQARVPRSFTEAYPNSSFETITPEHFWNFIR